MFIHRFHTIFALALLPTLSFAEPADLLQPEFATIPEPLPKSQKRKPSPAKNNTAKTPAQLLGRYMPKLKSALASRWAGAVTRHMAEFSPGNTTLNFKLDAEGNVSEVAVTANTSNEQFAKFCDQFVRETKFEPPPAGVLTGGLIEIPFTFTIY